MFFWPFHWLFLGWLFGHGIGSILIIFILIWAFAGHPWRRWHYGYHPYYSDPRWSGPSSSALSVLEERYAKGEIQREEYLQKKQDLQNPGR